VRADADGASADGASAAHGQFGVSTALARDASVSLAAVAAREVTVTAEPERWYRLAADATASWTFAVADPGAPGTGGPGAGDGDGAAPGTGDGGSGTAEGSGTAATGGTGSLSSTGADLPVPLIAAALLALLAGTGLLIGRRLRAHRG